MVDGVKDGAAPKAVTTYMEEESRRDFEAGKATFMRNWPYAYALGEKARSKVKGKFEVMPFPAFEGGGKAGILGGHNQVISRLLEEPGRRAEVRSTSSTRPGEPEDARCSKYSLAADARGGLRRPGRQEGATVRDRAQAGASRRPRPVRSRRSTRRSRRRSTRTSTTALSGEASPEDALKKAQTEINKALADLLETMADRRRTASAGAARRRSRGIPERRLAMFMVSPSMLLIALVAV